MLRNYGGNWSNGMLEDWSSGIDWYFLYLSKIKLYIPYLRGFSHLVRHREKPPRFRKTSEVLFK